MTICKNEALNTGGSYPRSCPTCKFGPCQRGVTPTLQSPYPENMYVDVPKPAVPSAPPKYAVVIMNSYTETYDSRHGSDSYPVPYLDFKEFETEEGLIKWIKDNDASHNKSKVFKYVKFYELQAETIVSVKLV